MDIVTIIAIVLGAIAIIGLASFGLILKWLDKRFEKKTKIVAPFRSAEEIEKSEDKE